METEDTLNIVMIIFNILGIIALLLGGLWAYTRYVLERGLLPPIQFDVECNKLGQLGDGAIFEFGLHLKNVGSSTLVARWIFIDIRYLKRDDKDLICFTESHRAGRLQFKHSLIHDDLKVVTAELVNKLRKTASERYGKQMPEPAREQARGLPILPHDTFVQPGVDQLYSFVTKLPCDTACVLVYASFQYGQHLLPLQASIYRLSRKIGLIHYSLQHVLVPHTIERAFWVGS